MDDKDRLTILGRMETELKLPWRLVITSTGGVVLDAMGSEMAFCESKNLDQMRAGIEMLNTRAAFLGISKGGVICHSGKLEKSELSR